jgi:MYXO-CTERM domain-containing protein
MKRILIKTLAGGMLAALSTGAQATTIIATFNSMTPSSGVTVTYPSTTTNTSAGRFNFTRVGGDHPQTPLPDSPVSRIWAFCVELGQSISTGDTVTFDVLPLESGSNVAGGIGVARADALRELLGAAYPDFSQVLTNNQYAALQIAIWEITRENVGLYGYDVSTGDVKFSGSTATILGLANTYLSQVDGVGPRAQRIRALVNERKQDMLVQFPVPEPGSLALALLGLGAVFGTRRRATA